MKKFDITFVRTIETSMGKHLLHRTVTSVPAKTLESARRKAHRKICFSTKYDHWNFVSAKEIEEAHMEIYE